MARPTGVPSKARRVPADIDAAIQREADRRGLSWADELRRSYTHAERASVESTGLDSERLLRMAEEISEAGLLDHGGFLTSEPSAAAELPPVEYPAPTTPGRRCRCAKPVMSKTVTNLCTVCHQIR